MWQKREVDMFNTHVGGKFTNKTRDSISNSTECVCDGVLQLFLLKLAWYGTLGTMCNMSVDCKDTSLNLGFKIALWLKG